MNKILLTTVCILLTTTTIVTVHGACPTNFEEVRWSGSQAGSTCIQIPGPSIYEDFNGCMEKCSTLHADSSVLSCINSQEQQDALIRYLRNKYASVDGYWKDIVWVGMHSGAEENKWEWSGTCENQNNLDFKAWNKGEPNNFCIDEDCVAMSPTRFGNGWVDISCTVKAQCMCETPRKVSPTFTAEIIANLKTNHNNYKTCSERKKEKEEEDRDKKNYNNIQKSEEDMNQKSDQRTTTIGVVDGSLSIISIIMNGLIVGLLFILYKQQRTMSNQIKKILPGNGEQRRSLVGSDGNNNNGGSYEFTEINPGSIAPNNNNNTVNGTVVG